MARTGDTKQSTRNAPHASGTNSGARTDAPTQAPPEAQAGDSSQWCARMLRHGWASIAVWMTFGLLLEGLLGYKTPAYLQDDQRRELFRLAHTHGTFLGLVLVAAALCGPRFAVQPPRAARVALRAGALVMPLGFLLAGVWHYEGDPGLAIWLVPPAALAVIFGAITCALAGRAGLKADK